MSRQKSDPSGYQPISCHYHDELEALATLAVECEIYSRNNHDQIQKHRGIIVNFRSDQGEEYMILDNGSTIRLDHILSVNGLSPDHERYR